MNNDARQYYLRQLQNEWPRWGFLDRGEAVMRLHNEGYSLRQLAKVAGCSEGTIRNYEIVWRVPPAAHRFLDDGRVSMRRLVKEVRKARKPQVRGVIDLG
jgi:predicted transcriptional regulator